MNTYISGIQQIGIGVRDAKNAMRHYKALLGMDTLVFDDISEATLMTQYTGGTVYKRRAILSMNLQGGGGFEIWQYKNREPVISPSEISYGDIGIYAAKIKSRDIEQSHKQLSASNFYTYLSPIQIDPKGQPHFWIKDAYNNCFEVVSSNNWFQKNGKFNGGVAGAVIGVSNMDKALHFYRTVLGLTEVLYDVSGKFDDNPGLPGKQYRRVLLHKPPTGLGAFNKLLGSIQIELVECLDRIPDKIFNGRYWGDCGFIHLCFDVLDMDGLNDLAVEKGYSFSIDSKNSFVMENASGRFCYIEDPDGTLIELVETHKVPILKKFGWYLDLRKRNIQKPLPDFMIKLLGLSKVK
jgi:catechol 2,3-dioxygenase-like lactoylglutathione lyase family enzyme